MLFRASIIIFGRDDSLLETRRLILDAAAFHARTVSALADAKDMIASHPYSLIILCHTLSIHDCGEVLAISRLRQPAMRHLVMTAGTPLCALSDGDEVLSAFDGPREFVATIQRLLKDDLAGDQSSAMWSAKDINSLQSPNFGPTRKILPKNFVGEAT